jgi:hypothetical protein
VRLSEDEMTPEDEREDAAIQCRIVGYYKVLDALGLYPMKHPWPQYWLWLMMVNPEANQQGMLS